MLGDVLKKLLEKLGDPGKFLIPCNFPGMDEILHKDCRVASYPTVLKPLTSEFILEEIEAYLKDDSISPEIDHADCDPEGDICLIEKLLNNDPFQLPPMDLKQSEVTKAKSSIEEPPELELKDLPSHLEYAYLEENNKLPVIIAKGLKDDEKEALLKVLKSHKRAIAWKITDIKEHKAYWALKHANFDLKTLGDHRKLQLNELNELRDQAYENSLIYKERTKKLHDSKIKNRIFNVGDRVLLFNSRLKIFSGKLKTRWSGPFTITKVFSYRTIELCQPDGPNFKVNGHRVKHYFGEDFPPKVVPDLQTFPKDE
ncbi:hypothetical protein Tco_0060042 [Tanacetum coccineum]